MPSVDQTIPGSLASTSFLSLDYFISLPPVYANRLISKAADIKTSEHFSMNNNKVHMQ